MTSRHLVDPQLLPALEMMPGSTFNAETLPAIREGAAQMALMVEPRPDVEVKEHSFRSPEGHELRIIVYTPKGPAKTRPAIFSIHGGGYILGKPEQNAGTSQDNAAELDCVVAATSYRLAPETKHPGPLEDCYAGLKWLRDQAAALGVDPDRIAVMGDSAGGGLAAALALAARDRGEVKIAHLHLIYPMLDDRTCTGDPHPYAGEYVWSPESNVFGWSSLLGEAPGGEHKKPYAAAARESDLSGLPPTYIMVGALDLFVDEDISFAQRLIRAGVPTELHVLPGGFHAFDRIPGPEVSDMARQASVSALRRGLAKR